MKKDAVSRDRLVDKCRGTLVAGAAGDALGYAVEFLSFDEIVKQYGGKGITAFQTDIDGVALVSDDTQMTLFTADGLLSALLAEARGNRDVSGYISAAYQHWYVTQTRRATPMKGSFLTHVRRMWERRAPGNTCMTALDTIMNGTGHVSNNSKGCGAVMRVAPIAIYGATHPDVMNFEHMARLAGASSEITHCHAMSTYASMALTLIIAYCLTDDNIDRTKFRFIVIDRAMRLMRLYYPDNVVVANLYTLVHKAIWAAESDEPDVSCIANLGEGWIAEETLAIALFSVMRHIDSVSECLECAVNHSGDSDSTGSVAGNIIGAIKGFSAIPQHLTERLELRDLIVSVADDLAGATDAATMRERYVLHRPAGVAQSELLA